MASNSGKRRRRSALPIDDLVDSYNECRGSIPSQMCQRNTPNTGLFSLPQYVDSGNCTFECMYCGALFWLAEKSVHNSCKNKPVYRRCCKLGKVVLPTPQTPPSTLLHFYNDANFREHIRAYNALFAMTSFGAKVDTTVNEGHGPYTFKVSGQISHWIGSLCPDPENVPRFLKLYIYDSANEVSNRLNIYNVSSEGGLRPDVVGILSTLLGSINKYVRVFKTAKNIADDQGIDEFSVRLYNNIVDARYGLPECDMVGGIVGGEDPNTTEFDIIVHSKSGEPHRITKLHPSYMSLQYPLLFPCDNPGWSPYMKLTTPGDASSGSLTIYMYYCYLCHDRQSRYSLIVKGGRLFQQFLVDSYVCIEGCRLDYIRTHQNELRAEYVTGVYDAITRGDYDGRSIGKRVLLPSSFVGGPRYMYSHYQDALAISRVYGNPRYFITFTCNVGWEEVRRFMSDHNISQAQDRPDILSRIFRIKVMEFIAFLKEDKSFGEISAYLYTIEFQKRGLPHCHSLVWVSASSRIITPDDIDRHISAEMPDRVEEERLYNIVTRCMLHGPCGFFNLKASCMRDGVCKKGFPKPFNDKTFFEKNGYVHYRRRDVSKFITSAGARVHNGFVVPFNKRLSSRFNAHINVEYCGWNMMIKYLFKYISKGVDRVSYMLQSNDTRRDVASSSNMPTSSLSLSTTTPIVDEVQCYVDGHFICPHEAA